jgi:hypothetical protein
MIKPRDLTTEEFFALSPLERHECNAELDAWKASPEWQAEARAYRERRQAAFEAKRLEEAEQIFRGTSYSRRCERLNLPARAVDVVLSGNMVDTAAVTAARGCTEILVLAGVPGCGKTVAACERVREFIYAIENWSPLAEYDTNPSFRAALPVWISACELARVDHFSATAVDRLKDAPLLVVDDLISEYLDAKGFFGSLFDELIDARYAGRLATVITTNLDKETFSVRYGLRVVDRLREAGRFFGCGATSMRGRASA